MSVRRHGSQQGRGRAAHDQHRREEHVRQTGVAADCQLRPPRLRTSPANSPPALHTSRLGAVGTKQQGWRCGSPVRGLQAYTWTEVRGPRRVGRAACAWVGRPTACRTASVAMRCRLRGEGGTPCPIRTFIGTGNAGCTGTARNGCRIHQPRRPRRRRAIPAPSSQLSLSRWCSCSFWWWRSLAGHVTRRRHTDLRPGHQHHDRADQRHTGFLHGLGRKRPVRSPPRPPSSRSRCPAVNPDCTAAPAT